MSYICIFDISTVHASTEAMRNFNGSNYCACHTLAILQCTVVHRVQHGMLMTNSIKVDYSH